MEIKNEKFVTFAEAKKILESKAKERELGYEQKNALEFLKKISKIPPKKAEEMISELKKIEKLKDRHVVAICDNLPQDLDDIRILFANEIITLSEEEKKKILAIVKKFT